MASRPQPVPTTPAASAKAPAYSCIQNCVELFDWWLHRVEGEDGKIGVAGFTSRNKAGRVFTSNAITIRHADGTLETADGFIVLTTSLLNISRTQQNGFPLEVCKSFYIGFPAEWEKCANANMTQTNEHSRSPLKSTSSGSLSDSTEHYIMKFLRGSYINSMGCGFSENDFKSSKRSGSNTDISPIQRHSKMSNETAPSQELFNCGLDIPEEPFMTTEGTCNNGHAGEEDNHQGSMHKYASGQEMDTHSVDSALINSSVAQISTDLEECRTPKCGKPLAHLGSEEVLEVPDKGMSSRFGVVQCSEDSTIRRLRNGKVFGLSSGPSLKQKSYNRRMQNKTLNKKTVPNEIAPPADLANHKNGGSVA